MITGWTGDIAEEIEKYKADIDWDSGSMATYELSYNTETPLGALTIKKGSAYLPKEGDWREPIPLGYGFYLCGTATNRDEDYIKVHEPWSPATVDGTRMFQLCQWLYRWDYPTAMLVNGSYMFYNSYLREVRDDSAFHTSFSRLENGENMFYGCCLDKESIRVIATQIPDWSSTGGTHKLYLGIDNKIKNDEDVTSWRNLITSKGWTLSVLWTTYYIS